MSKDNFVPTDYSRRENWLTLPETSPLPADVVFLYPTCYSSDGQDLPLVCSSSYEPMREKASFARDVHAQVFRDSANLYMPFYAQVDAFGAGRLTQREQLDLYEGQPMADVFAALDYYFEHYNQGKPFFLAGHSQGSVMTLYIMAGYFHKRPQYFKRLVAAYAIGFGVTRSNIRDFPYLKMAQGAGDTGVVVSYNTEGPGNAHARSVVLPPESVSINPLNWRTDDAYAGVEMNKGSLIDDGQGHYSVGPGLADARLNLQRGTVVCSTADPERYASSHTKAFGHESFHAWDYRLYFENLRENIALRLQNFLLER